MFGITDALRRGEVASGPGCERLGAPDRGRELPAQAPVDIRRLGQEPVARAQLNHLHTAKAMAAIAAVIGMVITHAIPIWRTSAQ